MKSRRLLKLIEQRIRSEILVDDQVGEAASEKVESDRCHADGKDFDTLQSHVLRIPIVGIFAEANSVIDSPIFENVGAVGDHLFWFYPVISKFFDGINGHRLQRRGSAEIQKEWCRVLQANLERLVIERSDADRRKVRDLSFRKGLRIFHVK